MGVSLSFGKYLDRKQFEIIDVLNSPIGEDGRKYFISITSVAVIETDFKRIIIAFK